MPKRNFQIPDLTTHGEWGITEHPWVGRKLPLAQNEKKGLAKKYRYIETQHRRRVIGQIEVKPQTEGLSVRKGTHGGLFLIMQGAKSCACMQLM